MARTSSGFPAIGAGTSLRMILFGSLESGDRYRRDNNGFLAIGLRSIKAGAGSADFGWLKRMSRSSISHRLLKASTTAQVHRLLGLTIFGSRAIGATTQTITMHGNPGIGILANKIGFGSPRVTFGLPAVTYIELVTGTSKSTIAGCCLPLLRSSRDSIESIVQLM